MGLLLMVLVHAASIQDRDGAKLLLDKARHCFTRLRLIWADGGYKGKSLSVIKVSKVFKFCLVVGLWNAHLPGSVSTGD
jgi:hypothetical protein